MEASVGGMLVMGVLLAAIVLMSGAIVVSNTLMGNALTEAADVSGERSRTVLAFQTATSTGSNLDVAVKNTGSTSVSAYEKMDFIVSYESGGSPVVARLTYVDSSPSSNQWTEESISPDVFQPGTWDPSETITLDANISPGQDTSTAGAVRVATPNGVVAVGTFTAP